MSRHWKLTLTAIAMGMALAGCVPGDDYYGGGGYAAGGYGYNNYGYGYCDDYGCPSGDYDLAYGGAYYGGIWYDQPLYYRDFAGGRQYWIHGGWHRDEWNGVHPADHRGHDAAWWRANRPAQANGGNNTGGSRGPRPGRNDDRGFRNHNDNASTGSNSVNNSAAQPVQNQAQDRGNRGFNRGDRGDGGNRSFSRGDGNGGGRASGGGDGGNRSFSRGDGNGGGRSFSGGGGSRSSGGGGGGSSSGGSNNGGNGRSR